MVREYLEWLEREGIGLSGILTKMHRLELALQCLCTQAEDLKTEIEVTAKCDQVLSLLANLRTSLKKKTQTQKKLDQFAHKVPDLADVMKFITEESVTQYFKSTVEMVQSGQSVIADWLRNTMLIVAGRLLLW